MLFVTVGTQKFPFDRLLRMADALACSGTVSEQVFAQTGHSRYQPRHCGHAAFLAKAEFEARMRAASVIITHGGVGAIVAGLKLEKPVIVAPRLRKYGEHVDDHQLEIAEAFCRKELVLLCSDAQSLEAAVVLSRCFPFQKYESQQNRLLDTINAYLEGMSAGD